MNKQSMMLYRGLAEQVTAFRQKAEVAEYTKRSTLVKKKLAQQRAARLAKQP